MRAASVPVATYVACRQMKRRTASPSAPIARARDECAGWRVGAPLLGIAWRLGLGLAAVAAVLVGGEVLATRTTRDALEAVRAMQNEHEPLANSADAVLEKLVAYDRAVGAYVQARSGAGRSAPSRAPAMRSRRRSPHYFANRPAARRHPGDRSACARS